ncbi:MAG: hypothetical protein IJG36_11070 [Synergistaceae bacterium]|nr:hypothetical protein [Synergistaceae bacterium]
MKDLTRDKVCANIQGKEYQLRELSLSEKNKLIGGLGEFINNIAKNAFFKKSDDGGISFNFIDEISLAELNIDKIILGAVNILPELLKLAVPDFNDWDNLPESESRALLLKVIELQDFKGYITNFFSLGTAIIR